LRGLQGQRTGDSDEELEQPQKFQREPRESPAKIEIEKPALSARKENAPIAKKASMFIGSVAEAYQAPEPRGITKVADFDDIEGVKNRQKKWEDGQVAGPASGYKQAPEGYKVDETEDTKARRAKWEEGQVAGAAGGYKQNTEGYKVDETEEVKARRTKWEEGQVGGAAGYKQNTEGYKVDETEEVKARRTKWEGGQVIQAVGTKAGGAEGYQITDSTGVKDRLNQWSQVSAEPTLKTERKLVSLVQDEETGTDVSKTKDRLKAWEDGGPKSPEPAERKVVKVAEEEDVAAVKERLNKWTEVTKEPVQSPSRKEPLKIYDDNETPQ